MLAASSPHERRAAGARGEVNTYAAVRVLKGGAVAAENMNERPDREQTNRTRVSSEDTSGEHTSAARLAFASLWDTSVCNISSRSEVTSLKRPSVPNAGTPAGSFERHVMRVRAVPPLLRLPLIGAACACRARRHRHVALSTGPGRRPARPRPGAGLQSLVERHARHVREDGPPQRARRGRPVLGDPRAADCRRAGSADDHHQADPQGHARAARATW